MRRADRALERVDEVEIEILDDASRGAGHQGRDGDGAVAGSGQHDDRRSVHRGEHGLEQGGSAVPGKVMVERHDIDAAPIETSQARRGIGGEIHPVAAPHELGLHEPAEDRIVIDAKKCDARHAAPGSGS